MKFRMTERRLIIILLIAAPFVGATAAFVDSTIKGIQREMKFQEWAEKRNAKIDG